MTVQSYWVQVSEWTGVYIYCVRPNSVVMVTVWKIRAKGFHFSPVGSLVIGSVGVFFLPHPPDFISRGETFYSYAFIIFVRVGVSVDQN